MAIDPSRFDLYNVADTCAIWNVLSSWLFYSAARGSRCSFCCTGFVLYECLHKPRTEKSEEDEELRARFKKEYETGSIESYGLEITDLQDVDVLEKRKRLSKGELSSIVWARKTRQAFLTDDQKARKLAGTVLSSVQTTPHLFGWLFFMGALGDSDKDKILDEHERLGRPLRNHLEEMYEEGMRCRLAERQ